AKKVYEQQKIDLSTLQARVAQVVLACFNGRRIVVFSGGAAKDAASLLDEARAIRDGGGNGSIIGRNSFQRPRGGALVLLDGWTQIYGGKQCPPGRGADRGARPAALPALPGNTAGAGRQRLVIRGVPAAADDGARRRGCGLPLLRSHNRGSGR